jgi:hypothetical protein
MKKVLLIFTALLLLNCSKDKVGGQKDFTCDDPVPFLFTSLSPSTKQLKWSANPDVESYTVRHGIAGFDVENNDSSNMQTINTNETNVIIEYNPSTGFREVYIKSNCSNDISSNWVGPLRFSNNGSLCGASSVSASTIDNSSIYLNWGETWVPSYSATSWTIEFGLSGFTLGDGTIITTDTDSLGYTIAGLTQDTAYDFYIKGNCDNNGESLYTGFISYTIAN